MLESTGPGRWRAVGRLLPAEVRERVFEPAFSDLLRKHLQSRAVPGSTVPFGVQVIGMLFACGPAAIPRLFIHRGRFTKIGKIAAWGLTALIVIAAAMSKIGAAYAAGVPSP